MKDEVLVAILSDEDLVAARAQSRALAETLGFSRTDATLIATAISEVARNIIVHARGGEIEMRPIYENERYGLVVVARDSGPGIRDVRRAMEASLASRGGLGLGLPGVRRLMDEFEIDSEPGEGTTVTMTKWRMRDELERLRERKQRRTDASMEKP